MPYLNLVSVNVDFPVYPGSSRLLRRAIVRSTTGGLLGKSVDDSRIYVKALSGVSVQIGSGDRVALIGHNGAGKTTLLRCMAGIYHPTHGHIYSEGARVPLFDISLGFDEEASGYENILLRGLLLGLSRSQIEQRTDDIAAFSGLGDFLNLPVRTYSSGMTLRLLFSIATSVDADILLMDEWIATGDQDFLDKADARLRKLVDRSHILVLASHNLQLLKKLCNRGLVFEGGRLVFDGSIDDAVGRYSAPAPVG